MHLHPRKVVRTGTLHTLLHCMNPLLSLPPRRLEPRYQNPHQRALRCDGLLLIHYLLTISNYQSSFDGQPTTPCLLLEVDYLT